MFCNTVSVLVGWMYDTFVDPVLIDMVKEYLHAQGSTSMESCLAMHSMDYIALARASDDLRWDSFVERRISHLWLSIMKPTLLEHKQSLYMSPQPWGKQFIAHLISITHKQWIYRNTHLHHKGADGLT